MAQVTIKAKPDGARVVGKPSLLRQIGEDFNLSAMTIVEPSLKREIRRRLAKTPLAHKFNPSGSPRTAIGLSAGGSEIAGSKTERETRVRVAQDKASGAGAGRGGRGASYTVEATSLTMTHDGKMPTLAVLIAGRKSRGMLAKPMSFWGRRGNEGRVRVRPWTRGRKYIRPGVVPAIRYMGIKPDPQFGERVFNSNVKSRLSTAFVKAITDAVTKDQLRDFNASWNVTVEL